VAIAGIAMEIGIEPTARHAADLGIIPVVITDACGAGHADAAPRSCEALHFAGDAIMTDNETFCAALAKAMIPKSMPSGLTRGGYRFSEKIMPK
jgi:nicotinamidase-related amidase